VVVGGLAHTVWQFPSSAERHTRSMSSSITCLKRSLQELATVPTCSTRWNAWDRDAAGVLAFPPMQEVIDRTVVRALRNADYHSMHDVIRASKAIVSKPGGCTLIDSLAAATPVVLLQPFGYAEDTNATIWKHLGFGISYAAWRETGYDEAVLARLHANILRRTRGIGYAEAYVDQLLETSR